MGSQNIVVYCRASLPDGRNSRTINKNMTMESDVLASFRGPGKEEAFKAWVTANYPGYVYAPFSGSVKQPADLGHKKTKTGTRSPKKKQEEKKKMPVLIAILIFPFKLIWLIIKGIVRFNKWLDKK